MYRGCRGLERPDSSVIAILWGSPTRVLLVRKRCDKGLPWACDLALPGGRIKLGEDPWRASLREAWEEAWIPRDALTKLYSYCCEETLLGGRRIHVNIALAKGPIDPRPGEPEVDAALWIPLYIVEEEPRLVLHPLRGYVPGIALEAGLVLWGATMRILKKILFLIGTGAIKAN